MMLIQPSATSILQASTAEAENTVARALQVRAQVKGPLVGIHALCVLAIAERNKPRLQKSTAKT